MKKPILVILAAGMGSRYGGLKQMDPMDEYGNALLDFSVYDAIRAGFEDVCFIIKHEIEHDFRTMVGDKLLKHINVRYAFQELDKLPEGIELPEGRTKPWGTTHAVLCAKEQIDAPFVVLNSDDFYGPQAFKTAFEFLAQHKDANEHAIICYKLSETLTDYGSVNRGVCSVSDGRLRDIHECIGILKQDDSAVYTDADGKTVELPLDSSVSMNFWAFNMGIFGALERTFPTFIAEAIKMNPLKCEDYLPEAVRRGMAADRLIVHACTTPDKWIGVTHKDDKLMVMREIQKLKDGGVYPEELWN